MIYAFSYGSSPTYVQLENCPSFPFSFTELDKPITSIMQNGYRINRPRFTKPRYRYSLSWLYLIETDKDSILTMEQAISGVENFTWYYEYPTSTTGANYYTVVLDKAINYELVMRTEESSYWNITMSLTNV